MSHSGKPLSLQNTEEFPELIFHRCRIVGLVPTAHYLAGKPLKDGTSSCVGSYYQLETYEAN